MAERNGGAMPDRNVGVSRKRASMANDEEYGEGSSGSDHDDPFSVSVCVYVCACLHKLTCSEKTDLL